MEYVEVMCTRMMKQREEELFRSDGWWQVIGRSSPSSCPTSWSEFHSAVRILFFIYSLLS